MKKNEKETIKKLTKTKSKEKSNLRWVLQVSIMAFLISFFFSFGSELILPNVNVVIGIILVILFIGLGILFDIVGTAVTAASEKPFHSMSAQKIRGSKVAIQFKKNANKVSSFCNDVIGDICGIISGSAGVTVAVSVSTSLKIDPFFTTLCVTALIAALTIGGKALGKTFAINKSNIILYEFAKAVSYLYHPKK